MVKKYLLISLFASALVLVAAFMLDAVVPTTPETPTDARLPGLPVSDELDTATMSDSCASSGGNWLFEYGECENVGETWCSEEGGRFEECDSACRHEADEEMMCTLQCVPVCSFGTQEENAGGETSGPQLDADTAAKLVINLMGHCVVQGTCDKMEIAAEQGADGVWRVEMIEHGLRDDSVRDKRTVLRAEDTETGWRLEEKLSEEFICQTGHGQQEFSPDLCN